MIKISQILNEGVAEQAAVDLLSGLVKQSKWRGKVFIAGGYVRDELLGNDPKDIDLVVEFPQGGIEFAEWVCKKLKIYKKGSNPVIYPTFGTAAFKLRGVVHNGIDLSDMDIECVMTRKEQYTKGSRKPMVSPGTLKDDVERRDFTVNSLLKSLTNGEILDLTGMGKQDLEDGIIRTPLDPDVIFSDDPLRMLRAVRFTVKYNWQLPMFMLKAMKRNAHMLKTISAERIRSELDKMLLTKYPDKAIRIMNITGLNKYVMPEFDLLRGIKQGKHHKFDAYGHSLEVLKNVKPDLVRRLGALFHDIGKSATQKVVDHEVHFYGHEDTGAEMAREIMTRLKYPKEIIKQVMIGIKNHMRTKAWGDKAEKVGDKAIRKLQNDLGDHLELTLDIIHADNISHADASNMPDQVDNIRIRLKDLTSKKEPEKLPVTGKDVMDYLGLSKGGPLVGQALAMIKDAWLENPNISKEQALKLILTFKK